MYRSPGTEGTQTGPPDEAFRFEHHVLVAGHSIGVCGPNLSESLGGGTMDNPRPEKVAVVDEVRERMDAADGALLTEYRGLDRRRAGRAPP